MSDHLSAEESGSSDERMSNRPQTPSHSPTKTKKSHRRSISAPLSSPSPTRSSLHKIIKSNEKKMSKNSLKSGTTKCILHSASQSLLEAASSGSLVDLRAALDSPLVHVNYQDDRGRCALHLASVGNHLMIVRFLIDRGADIALQDLNGNTALHLAVISNHTEVVLELLKSGADPEVMDRFHRSPLDLVQSRLRILSRLTGMETDQTEQLINNLRQLIQVLSFYKKADKTILDIKSLTERLEQVKTGQDIKSLVNDLQGALDTMSI